MSHDATSIASLCRAPTPGTARATNCSARPTLALRRSPMTICHARGGGLVLAAPSAGGRRNQLGADTGAGTERDAHPAPRQRWVFRPSSPLS